MAVSPMLVVCALDAGCTTRDGTLQPKGTAFDRVATNPDGSDFAPGPGFALIADDGRALYVQNSGGHPLPTTGLPQYPNDAAARAGGLQDWQYYLSLAGVQQLQGTRS